MEGKCEANTEIEKFLEFFFNQSKQLVSEEHLKEHNQLFVEWLQYFGERRDSKYSKHSSTDEGFVEWRLIDGHLYPFLLIFAFDCGLRITDEIKCNEDYIGFNVEVNKHGVLVNDLFSFVKESGDGFGKFNYVYVKMKNNNMSVEEAMDQIVSERTTKISEFADEDGKIPLLVTAVSPLNEALPRAEVMPQPLSPGKAALKAFGSLISETAVLLNTGSVGAVGPQPIGIVKDSPQKPMGAYTPPIMVNNSMVNLIKAKSFLCEPGIKAPVYPSTSINWPTVEPMVPKKETTDKNFVQTLVSGFENLFSSSKKSSKSSPPKSALKTALDSEMISDPFLMTLTPIYYPELPFRQYFTGGLAEGFTFCISGRLNRSADCFSIDFSVTDSDIAFHLNVRHMQSVVVRNTLVNGIWGPEERDVPYYPFEAGKPLDVVIRIKRDRYVVAVDRQHLCNYEHRMGFRSVTKVSVSGDISVNYLRYTSN